MAIRIQNRRGTASEWTAANPTLASGEIGYETDTGKFKIGDGSTAWSSLGYFEALSGFSLGELSDVVTTNKAEGSVLYYDSATASFKADDINTKLTLADGGNF